MSRGSTPYPPGVDHRCVVQAEDGTVGHPEGGVVDQQNTPSAGAPPETQPLGVTLRRLASDGGSSGTCGSTTRSSESGSASARLSTIAQAGDSRRSPTSAL